MELPGIHGVFTGEDLDLGAGLPMAWVPPGVEVNTPEHWPLAKGAVKYVGQGVVAIVGEDKYAVVDAAEQVLVEYDPLPVVVDPEKALEDGSPLVHEEFGTNKTHEWSIGGGDMDTAWADADVVLERRIVNHRTAGTPIEPRVVPRRLPRRRAHAAAHEPGPAPDPPLPGGPARHDRGRGPRHRPGRRRRLRREDHDLRRRRSLAAWISRKVGRPVKWTETRSEHMSSSIHGRDQIDYVKIGAKRDGTITGLECTAIADLRRLLHAADAVHLGVHGRS